MWPKTDTAVLILLFKLILIPILIFLPIIKVLQAISLQHRWLLNTDSIDIIDSTDTATKIHIHFNDKSFAGNKPSTPSSSWNGEAVEHGWDPVLVQAPQQQSGDAVGAEGGAVGIVGAAGVGVLDAVGVGAAFAACASAVGAVAVAGAVVAAGAPGVACPAGVAGPALQVLLLVLFV